MTTAEQIAAIKLGSNVTYVDGDGVEHGAIAKGLATTGFDGRFKAFMAVLTLIYLDAGANVVQVNAAPLLTEAQDDEFIGKAADFMADRDAFASKSARSPMQSDDVTGAREAHLQRLVGQPIKIGWKFAEVKPCPDCGYLGESTENGSSSVRYGKGGDYSQPGDPYGIGADMTSQSAAVDVRGNSQITPRPVPTQAEADAIVAEAGAEKAGPVIETKKYSDGTTATGPAPLPDLSPAQQDARDEESIRRLTEDAEVKLAPFQPEESAPIPSDTPAAQNEAADQSA